MGHKQTQEYYEQSRNFSYWSSVKQHEENTEELKIQVDNHNAQAAFTDRQNKRTYDHSVKQQNFRHDQDMRQYVRSNEIADEQINYNRMSASLAMGNLKDQIYERYQKLQFESAGALLKHRVAQQKLRQGRRELLQGHGLATAKAAIQAQELIVKKMKSVGKAEARGVAGRSTEKEVGQWMGVAGREQAAMLDMVNRANEQVSTKLYGIEYTMGVEMHKRHLTLKAQKATADSIRRASKRGAEEIVMKHIGADMQANHKRLLVPEKGPAPIKPDAMPRLDWGDNEWKDSFVSHGGFYDADKVKTLDVFKPDVPGLSKDFVKEMKTEKMKKKYGKWKGVGGGDAERMGPMLDHRKDHSGVPQGFGGTGARGSGISVGSVTAAVGAAMGAASAIGAATATGAMAGAGAIGLGGLGSVGLGMMGPIGMGIAAIGFIGTIFDWW